MDDNAVRPEIQALRALAVTLVVVYHLAPYTVPGGYIGVDVFFVISGFLITSHVARGLTSSRGFSLAGFYVRRARRLLPASLVTLLVVAVVVVVFLPVTTWNDTGRQVVASVFYVQNWLLAVDSVDYLAAGASASPVQHFWSLSVEEQFYLIWPILLMAVAALARGRTSVWWALRIAAVSVVVLSLGYSAFETTTSPSVAYFVTPTRAWELATGGLLALSVPEIHGRIVLRTLLGWCGVVTIVVCAFMLDGASPFPGVIAIIPIAATVAVIAAGDVPGRASLRLVANRRLIQWVGDLSYSIYLWHWPLIVLVPLVIGGPGYELPSVAKVLVAASSLPVAWLSKRFVEDRFRTASTRLPAQRTRRRHAPVLLTALAGMLVVGAVGSLPYALSETRIERAQESLRGFQSGDQSCVGAASLDRGCTRRFSTVQPAPIIAGRDAQAQNCQQRFDRQTPVRCDYGSSAPGAVRIAVVGDSHANQWMPAILAVADQRGWHVTTWFKSGCAYAHGLGTDTCRSWGDGVSEQLLAGRFSVVITSARSGIGYASRASVNDAANAFAMTWHPLMAAGARVVAIADTPQLVDAGIYDPPGCVAGGQRSCVVPEDSAFRDDALPLATSSTGATLVDLRNKFCTAGQCPPVIGGVLVYRDQDHMTALYARTLAPYLAPFLDLRHNEPIIPGGTR